jgi:mRNA interferase MazF
VQVRRGEIFFADLNPVVGSEQGGLRPVLILQNDIGNTYSPTTIVAALTSRIKRAKLPTHVEVAKERYSLDRDSVILLEQLRTIDKQRLKERVGALDEEAMTRVENALIISLGLNSIE